MLVLATQTTQKGSPIPTLVMAVAFFLFYWFYMRPRSKKRREQLAQTRNYEVGDEIQTIGGLIATVTSIQDDRVEVQTSGGTKLTFVKRAIGGKYNPPVVVEEPSSDTEAEGQ